MTLKIYNTLTHKKEEFKPLNPPTVGMYVCGVTVYDLCHIGHARAAIVFDMIYRYLTFKGYKTTYVRNVTDIDDKIIDRATESGADPAEIAKKYTAELHRDMESLGLLPPDHEPKATSHIDEMIEMIQKLIDRGHAYELSGSVYFAVRSFPEYGRLSGRNLDDLMAGARVAIDEGKRDALDFALWKAEKPGEPSWDCPWGKGRPGWHIECSAMGRKYLGVTFDIHGGGKDLVFPHHENEIAQSHGSADKPPVKYWVHNGFVTVKEEKMSKSLGNFFTIQDLLKTVNAEALKLFLLSSHYRSPIDFADQYLADAYVNLARFYDALFFAESLDSETFTETQATDELTKNFTERMDDDFNTATALALLSGELKKANQLRADMSKMKKKSDNYKNAKENFLSSMAGIKQLGGVLGLFQKKPERFLESAKQKKLEELELTCDEVDSMIEARSKARGRKDFITADRIRSELDSKGIMLHDSPDGVTWSVQFD